MLNKKNLPKHVAFIMDGNRRWAKAHKLPVFKGYFVGQDRIEPLIDYAIELGVSHLTFWAFSTENWKREKREVEFLLNLFRENLAKKVDRFHQKNVRLNLIGDLKAFPRDIQKRVREWVTRTKNNTKITVNVALNYGGRDEIIRAINKWNQESRIRNKGTKITAEEFSNYLDTASQPDPDLLIRTGGVIRLSGFMPWQLEYTELYFSDVYWPDFTPREFKKALLEYQRRKRNFGK